MPSRKPVSIRILNKATKLRNQGFSWSKIVSAIGESEDVLRRRIDPDYQAIRTRIMWGYRKRNAVQKFKSLPDTRDFTARFMGDPLPGRSALDSKSPDRQRNYHPIRGFALDRLNEIRAGRA